MRTAEPFYMYDRVFKGRGEVTKSTRHYHLYILRPEGKDEVHVRDRRFVKYAEEHLDPRGGGGKSKAQIILDYITEHKIVLSSPKTYRKP